MKIEPTAVVVALIGVVGSITAAWVTASNKAESKAQEVATIKVQQLVDLNNTKLCSIVKPEGWRDNILVTQTWKPDTCKRFSEVMGAWNYQLGCVYNDEIAMGALNSGVGPMRNCGW
jgi:hypothetical protein